MDFPAQLSRFLEPIRSRIRMLIQRALVTSVDDSNPVQLIQVSIGKGEVKSKVERIQNYGFTGVPPEKGGAVLINLAGHRDNSIAVAVNHSSRKKGLASGEVAVYDKNGSYVLLKANGDIIVSNTGKIYLGNNTLLPTAGVVTGECLDPVTGLPFPDKSAVVLAQKVAI